MPRASGLRGASGSRKYFQDPKDVAHGVMYMQKLYYELGRPVIEPLQSVVTV